MGVTIHYDLKFKGTEAEAKKRLLAVAEAARRLKFKEVCPSLWAVNYATDFDCPDEFTPMAKDKNKEIINPDYRWAKIQYQPGPNVMLSYQDSPSERQRKEKRLQRWRDKLPRYSGYVQHVWFADGCEPTNIGLLRVGKSKFWTGSAFTKTQWASDFVKAHIVVCALLQEVQNIAILESVRDEGDFWKTRDWTRLMDSSEENLKVMRKFDKAFGPVLKQMGLTMEGPAGTAKQKLDEMNLDGRDG